MAERTDEGQQDSPLDVQANAGSPDTDRTTVSGPDDVLDDVPAEQGEPATPEEPDGPSLARRLLAPRPVFGISIAAALGAAIASQLPLVPTGLTTVLGIGTGLIVGGFFAGLTGITWRYRDPAVAGALVGLLTAVRVVGLSRLSTALSESATSPAVLALLAGIGFGLVLAIAGTYLGLDLRDGLTRSLR